MQDYLIHIAKFASNGTKKLRIGLVLNSFSTRQHRKMEFLRNADGELAEILNHVYEEGHDDRQASISVPFLNMKHTCSLL